MANDEKDELESENQDDGGETGDKKTTEKDDVDYKQIAEDQRKRAEKAEKDLKALKTQKPKEETTNTQSVDPDELKLIARGLSDEEIEQAKVIAKGTGKSLLEATKNPLFEIFQKDLKAQAKKDAAKLGASKGSTQTEEVRIKPGMTRDEHKEAWNKAMGK